MGRAPEGQAAQRRVEHRDGSRREGRGGGGVGAESAANGGDSAADPGRGGRRRSGVLHGAPRRSSLCVCRPPYGSLQMAPQSAHRGRVTESQLLLASSNHRIPAGRGDSRAVCPSQNWLPLHRAQAGPKRHRSGHGRPVPMPVRCCFAVANSCRETPLGAPQDRPLRINGMRDSCNRVARCERRQRGHLPGLAGADGAQPCSPYP